MSKVNGEADFLGKGFHRLDDHLIPKRPPKIKWGPIYLSKTDAEKVAYLEKLAAAMNHAAHLIQGERDQLGGLCEKKEEQIASMKTALDQNNAMIQSQITKMNAEKQELLNAIITKNNRIRELEGGG